MRRLIVSLLSISSTVLLIGGFALAWDDVTWDEIRDEGVVIMPEQLLEQEIQRCAEGADMASCTYLAEMFDITKPSWYVVDAIPEGWRTDELNKGWRRKPSNEIRVKRAWHFVPQVLDAYASLIEKLENKSRGDTSSEYLVALRFVYLVSGQQFDNSQDLKSWLIEAKKDLRRVLVEGQRKALKERAPVIDHEERMHFAKDMR